jgi:hypothetical protein
LPMTLVITNLLAIGIYARSVSKFCLAFVLIYTLQGVGIHS